MTTIDKFWQEFKKKKNVLVSKQKTSGNLEHLIADEDHAVVKGRCHSIKVKKVKVPANHMVFTSLYRMNKHGNVSGVSEAEPKPIDMDRSIEYARFTSCLDGRVKRGDFLGYVMLLPFNKTLV